MGSVKVAECCPIKYERSDVKGIMDCGMQSVPQRFILPQHKRPNASQVVTAQGIPVIDVGDLDGPQRAQTIEKLMQACLEWGFFQVINHGLEERVLQNMIEASRRFHEQPIEEKMKYYSRDYEISRYCPGTDKPNDQPANWMDSFLLVCDKSEEVKWPPVCREAAMEYWKGVRIVGEALMGALSEGLGLSRDHLENLDLLDRHQVALNYYPRCPDPNLTLGISGHSDPGSLTVLLQDGLGGLQVLKDGAWVAAQPLPNAFVVNIADQMEIISNGKFRSVEHRVVTNSSEARISVPSFFSLPFDGKVNVICSDGEKPRYKDHMVRDYMHFFLAKYEGKSAIDSVKLT